jgi:hypothetical protein
MDLETKDWFYFTVPVFDRREADTVRDWCREYIGAQVSFVDQNQLNIWIYNLQDAAFFKLTWC